MNGSSKRLLVSKTGRNPALAALLGGASLIACTAGAQAAPMADATPTSGSNAVQPGSAAPSGPSAQTSGQDAAATTLSDIIVTAQRREQPLSKVPAFAQAVSASVLHTEVITDTQSLVAASPSVSFASSFAASGTGFVIRGISSSASEGGLQQSTAMVIDGVPLARPAEFVGDLTDIDRVEILPGPQGTLFGKNATAGVVNIVTQRPTDHFEGSIEVGGTNDSESTVRGMINIPINDSIRTRFTGYYDNLPSLIRNTGTGGNDAGYRNYGFMAKVDIDFSSRVNLRVTADYRNGLESFGQAYVVVPSLNMPGYNFTANQIATLGFTPQWGVIRDNHNGNTWDRTSGASVTAELGWKISDDLKLTSITGYRFYKSDSDNDVDGTSAGVQQGVGFAPNPTLYQVMYANSLGPRLPEDVSYISEEVRLNYTNDRINAVGGVFYQNLINWGPGPGGTPFILGGQYLFGAPALAQEFFYTNTDVEFKIHDDTYAAFGDVTYKITPTISLFGGLRFTHESIRDDYASQTWFAQITNTSGALLHNADGSLIFNPVTIGINAPSSDIAFNLSNNTNNLSGRAGIQWQPTSATNFYFSYNRGYKGPAVDVSRGATTPDPATGYSPILKPEIASSFELGTKLRFLDNRAQVDVNLFSEKIANLQQSIVLPSTVTELINSGGVESEGVEFSSRALVARGLTLEANATYMDPRYTGSTFVGCYPGQTVATGCVGGRTNLTGAQTDDSERLRFTLGATYQNDLPTMPFGLTVHVGYNWFDKSPYQVGVDPLVVQPSHGLLDASLTFDSHDKHWQVQLYGKNLTNDFYYSYLVDVNLIARLSGYIARDYAPFGGIRVKYSF